MTFEIDRRRFLTAATAVAMPLLPSSSAWSRPGTAWRFYRTGTDQPEHVYVSRDLSVTAGSQIETGANGRLPQLYLDPAIEYRAVLGDADGTVLAMLDPLPKVPSSGRIGAANASGRIVVSGAIGDGRMHPLSERFSSLAEARMVFASATDLSESLCGAAIQSAIDLAEQRGKAMQGGASVFVPAGRYPLSRSLSLPNNVVLEGEGQDRTIIDNQNSPLNAPLVVNANAVTARLSLRNMSLHGGTHGIRIRVSEYVAGLLVEQASFQLQTDKNIECNRLLQMATFRDCAFGLSPFGVYAAAWTSNVVAFDRCSFESHSRAHLYLRGAECITITGGRFEGGGVFANDRATIDIEDAAAVNFIGVYFENTHPVLLYERRSRNGVSFSGCHFTGTTGGAGLVPYQFDSDGIVTFGTNDWGLTTHGPAKVALHGVNDRLVTDGRVYVVRSATQHHIRSEQVEVARRIIRDLLTVRPEGKSQGQMTLFGKLVVEILRTANDGIATAATHQYTIRAATAGKTVTLRADPDVANAPALAVRSDPATGAAVSLALAPDVPSVPVLLQWTFEGTASGIAGNSRLHVDLA